MKSALFTFLLSISFITICIAQPYLEWDEFQSSNIPNGTDNGIVITSDDDNNVYVGGKIQGNGNYDYITIKYNPNGDTLWKRTYNGLGNGQDEILVIKTDVFGNVYVTGKSQGMNTGYDIVTIKYSSDGKFQWKNVFNGSLNKDDIGLGLAIDNFGFVFVVGSAGSDIAGVALKINLMGNTDWFKYQNNRYTTNNIIINNVGNLIVSSSSTTNTSDFFLILELNSNTGETLFTYNTNSAPAFDPVGGFANKIAIDNSNNIYVLSTHNSDFGLLPDKIIISKFSHNFINAAWEEPWLIDLNDHAYTGVDFKIDNDANVYALSDLFTGVFHLYSILKINANGINSWGQLFNIGNDVIDDYPVSLELSKIYTENPDIFVSTNTLTQNGNIALTKYTNAGDSIYTVFYDCNVKIDVASASSIDKCDNIYITGYSSCNNTGQDIKTIKYSTLKKPAINISNNPICIGDTIMLTTDTCTNCTFLWSDGQTGDTIFVHPDTTTNYSVTKISNSGCETISFPYKVTVKPLLVTSVNITQTSSAICLGNSVTLTAHPTNGGVLPAYKWYVNGVLQNVTISSITLSPTVNIQVHCVMTTSEQCHTQLSATSNASTIIVNPLPVATIDVSGFLTFCQGGSINLSSNSAPSYLWSNGMTTQNIIVSSSGTLNVTITDVNGCAGAAIPVSVTVHPLPMPIVNANGITTFCSGGSVKLTSTDAISYLWSNGSTTQFIDVITTGEYKVTATDGNGCAGVSAPKIVTAYDLPSASIIPSGATTFCSGNSVTLSSGTLSNIYKWNTGASTSSIVVSAAGDYQLTVTDSNGCTDASSVENIIVNKLPIVTIDTIGKTTFCKGGVVSLISNEAASYLWNTGATSKAINVNSSGTYYLTITDNNGCSNTSIEIKITANPLPVSGITPSEVVRICEGENVTLISNTASSYKWSNGATTSSITTSKGGKYSVIISDANGCSDTSSITEVLVNSLPVATITPSSSLSFCEGTSIKLTASEGNIYLWNNGETSKEITVDSSGQYKVIVTDNNGCSNESELIVTTELPLLTPKVEISTNSTSVCEGEEVTFNSTFTNGGANPSYQWFLDNVLQSEISKTFKTPSIKNGSKVFCNMVSSEQCLTLPNDKSNTLTMAVNPLKTPTIFIKKLDDKIFECEDANFEAIVTNEGNNPKFKWNINGLISGLSRIFTYSDLNDGDKVYCMMQSNAKCITQVEVVSDTLVLDVLTKDQPIINLSNDTIYSINYSNPNNTYTWYYNGNVVSNSSFIKCSENGSGDYYLLIKINECILTSSTLAIANCSVAINEIDNDNIITIYPNPTNGMVTITGNIFPNENPYIILTNVYGQEIYKTVLQFSKNDHKVELDLSHFVNGVYFVRVGNNFVKKVVKVE